MKASISFAAITALLMSSSSSFSADFDAPAGSHDWSGIYAGLHVGYGAGDADIGDVAFPLVFVPVDIALGGDVDGFLGGAQAGYNFQTDAWVYGIETDFSVSGIEGSTGDFSTLGLGSSAVGTTEVEVEWLATVRGRVGRAFDHVLLFATGGVAIAEVESSAEGVATPLLGPAAPFDVSESEREFGWTAGAGAEIALSEHLSLKAEYQYVRIDNIAFDAVDAFTSPGEDPEVDLELHAVKVGFNYRF